MPRCTIFTEHGRELAPLRRHIDNSMVKAVARAFRWRKMLEDGTYATIAEIADAERINESYVGRILRLSRRETRRQIVRAARD